MKKRILNLGCGSEKYGTDFVDVYPSRKEVLKCNVGKEKLPYRKDTFDEVYSRNLFEHIPTPLNILKETKKVLKKGGKIHFLTDNAGFFLFHLPFRKNNFLQHNSNKPRGGKDDRHYFLFTPLHLENLIDECGGFEKVNVKYTYSSPRKIVKVLKPIFIILNKTFLVRILNPHLVLEAYKK